MLRRRGFVGIVVAAVLALSGVVVLAQDVCTRTYRGDLVLEGNERLVITEGVLCVGGNIILRDNARLEISNATLRMTSPSEALWGKSAFIGPHDQAGVVMHNVRVETVASEPTDIWIWASGSARVELVDVTTVGSASLGVYAEDAVRASVRSSAICSVFVTDRAAAEVVDSSLEGVTLKFSTPSAVELSNLRAGAYQSWEIPTGTGVQPRLTLERTRVGGWRIEGTDLAHVVIRDSDIDHMALYPGDSWEVVSGIRPGHYAHRSLQEDLDAGTPGNVSLINTTVGEWTIYVAGRRRDFTLRNSVLKEFSVRDFTGQLSIERTTIVGLALDDCQLTLECDKMTVLHVLALTDSRLVMRGSLRFQYTARRVVWDSSTVGREYEVQVGDSNGDPVRGVRIGLEDPNGRVSHRTTDQEGLVRFTIWFYNTNYDKTWHLLVPQGDTTARVPITLLTSTPAQLSTW